MLRKRFGNLRAIAATIPKGPRRDAINKTYCKLMRGPLNGTAIIFEHVSRSNGVVLHHNAKASQKMSIAAYMRVIKP